MLRSTKTLIFKVFHGKIAEKPENIYKVKKYAHF
jgi:hypothetical protein